MVDIAVLPEGGPISGPKNKLLSNTQKFSEETHVLTKQRTLLGRGRVAECSSLREPRRMS